MLWLSLVCIICFVIQSLRLYEWFPLLVWPLKGGVVISDIHLIGKISLEHIIFWFPQLFWNFLQSTEVDFRNDWAIAIQVLGYNKIPQDLLDEFLGDILYCDNPHDSPMNPPRDQPAATHNNNNNNGPNGHLFYVGGDLMMRRGMLPIIMLPNGDLRIALHLVPFWILTIWGSVHIEETVVGWRNQLRMKTSAT